MFFNFKEAFTYIFKDEKFWVKYLIGTIFIALSTFPTWLVYPKLVNGTLSPLYNFLIIIFGAIIGIFNMGFFANFANSKITLNENVLPDWKNDFCKIAKTGLKFLAGCFAFGVASFCAILPILIVLGIIGSIIFGVVASPTINALGPNLSPYNPVFAALVLKFIIVMFIIFLPFFITWITFWLLSMISFLTDLKFVSFFNFKKMINLVRKNWLNLLILLLICCAFVIVSTICQNFINYHIYYAISILFGFYVSSVFYSLYAQFAQIGIQKNFEKFEEKQEPAENEESI